MSRLSDAQEEDVPLGWRPRGDDAKTESSAVRTSSLVYICIYIYRERSSLETRLIYCSDYQPVYEGKLADAAWF